MGADSIIGPHILVNSRNANDSFKERIGGDLPYKTTDLHWLAGILEGEGYFGSSTQNMLVACDMTDLDVMQRISSITGGKLYGPYQNGPLGRKPKWRVSLAGTKGASWMMTLYGLLGT